VCWRHAAPCSDKRSSGLSTVNFNTTLPDTSERIQTIVVANRHLTNGNVMVGNPAYFSFMSMRTLLPR
jgi:hypothetical protein